MNNIVFVCGTDTGSGKTVLTGLLTRFSRNIGIDAVAIKPLCSGSREDVEFLRLFQDSTLSNEEINPWFFNKPLSPYADLRKGGKYNFKKALDIQEISGYIKSVSEKHNIVFVEGIGGLMVPIKKNLLFIDVISELKSPVILTAKNKIGVINQTLVNIEILKKYSIKCVCVVLMNEEKSDLSTLSNSEIIAEYSGENEVLEIPFLRDIKPNICQEIKVAKIFKKILARF